MNDASTRELLKPETAAREPACQGRFQAFRLVATLPCLRSLQHNTLIEYYAMHSCKEVALPAGGGRSMRSLDVKSVRDRFRHLHSAASLGSASQQSLPSRASIDAHSSLGASQRSAPKPTSLLGADSKPGQHRQLPQPHGAPASEASILREFKKHREALQAGKGSSDREPAPEGQAARQDAPEAAQQAAVQAEATSTTAMAGEGM